LDLSALTVGYGTLVVLLMIVIPASLLLAAAFGHSTRGLEVLRASAQVARVQVYQLAAGTLSKLQTLVVVLLQLVLVPCYIGHLVVCLLCGPVLHTPQHREPR